MAATLTIGSHAIRRDGDMWCMTDLWRASGAPGGTRPANWLRKDGATFADFLRVSLDVPNGHITKARRTPGGGGETWAHWQLALAYAKALSPEFHARVNEVYRAYMAGQLVPSDPDVVRLALRIKALEAKDYESAWDDELKLELARLHGIRGWVPGRGNGPEPRSLRSAYGFTWRMILGETVYRELKVRNPHPRDGSLHGQWLKDERLRLVRREDMVITKFIAQRSSNWTAYAREMRSQFRRAPIQLRLVPGGSA